jgi:LAO/AO transport system kinase
VLIETVGVGQDEIDIVRLADITIVILVPGMGDDVQTIKAGIMEIADIFVINKSDREGAERVEREIRAMQTLAPRKDAWTPPIVKTVATEGKGIEELAAAIAGYESYMEKHNLAMKKKISNWRERLIEMLREALLERALREQLSEARIAEYAQEIAEHKRDPYSLVEEIVHKSGQGMRFTLDHLGIAVKSLAESRKFYEALGMQVAGEEVIEHEKVRVAMLPAGQSRLELLEATTDDSTIARFIARRGEGLHHIALSVDDLEATVARLKSKGVRLVTDKIQIGAGGHRYVFVHPAGTGGVLIELCQNDGR